MPACFSYGPELPIHFHEIEVVPGFNDFSVFDPDDRHSGKINVSMGGSKSQCIACMFSANSTSRRNLIALRDKIFHLDLNIGERVNKLRMKPVELLDSLYRF